MRFSTASAFSPKSAKSFFGSPCSVTVSATPKSNTGLQMPCFANTSSTALPAPPCSAFSSCVACGQFALWGESSARWAGTALLLSRISAPCEACALRGFRRASGHRKGDGGDAGGDAGLRRAERTSGDGDIVVGRAAFRTRCTHGTPQGALYRCGAPPLGASAA